VKDEKRNRAVTEKKKKRCFVDPVKAYLIVFVSQ
jgi:hypothetical protein